MNKTSIEWTHRPGTTGMTWNPVRARLRGANPKARSGTFCTRISPGCTNCYASVINKRFGNGLEFTVPNLEQVEYFVSEKILEEPLRRKKPATIFVGDMFDLFHEAIPLAMIAKVLQVCEAAPWHTFQLLTKRATRMREIFSFAYGDSLRTYPPKNVWCGVSVEDNKRAIERIPKLQETPAAVRFLSVEPQLEEIDFEPESIDGMPTVNMLTGADWCDPPIPGIDWVVCGGESGPGARPFNLAWAESLMTQCRAADVPFFMKQVGSKPIVDCRVEGTPTVPISNLITDRKGGDPAEWPEHLRVREFPAERLVTA